MRSAPGHSSKGARPQNRNRQHNAAAGPYRIVATLYTGEDQTTGGITIHPGEFEVAQRRYSPEVEIAARREQLHCLP